MKKNLYSILVCTLCCLSANFFVARAQDNSRVPLYIGTIDYESVDGLSTLAGIFMSDAIETEDNTIVSQLEEGIKSAPAKVYRLNVQKGTAPSSTTEDAYRLDAVLFRVMTGSSTQKVSASAKCRYTLTNLKTGKVVKQSKIWRAVNNKGFNVKTVAECTNLLGRIMDECTRGFLLNYFPLTGTILQKGIEQDNGKTKSKLCYIDIGDNMYAYKDLTFIVYTKDGSKEKEIGRLKLKDVQGEDISVCKITKGEGKIEKALQAGETVFVKTNVDEPESPI